ncbi:MAG: hypothetical protein JKY48_10050 [Flavobacteriales bacterium]|nr:hypothetical protein [Flavobacteriales bacterium]
MINPEIHSFYGWWQFSVCLFAFFALMSIWWPIGRKQKDYGQVWLALSVLCWSISGGIEILHVTFYDRYTMTIEGWRSILSLFNSLFILLALPWFKYLPKSINQIIKSKYWIYIVGLPFLFSLLPTINKILFNKSLGIISELDVYYAILTLGFLGYVLWNSFQKRRLKILSWLAIICIIITLIAELFKFTNSTVNLILLSSIFKSCLIMLFFALALSWVKELSENTLPTAKQLFLNFKKEKNRNGKLKNLITINGVPGIGEKLIVLSPAHYELFLKFALRKKMVGNEWLEIKPKNFEHTQKNFDINDYNEIKRLLLSLLDGLYGKDSWTKELHLDPLKKTLFEMSEKRERKIRLSIPESNITTE